MKRLALLGIAVAVLLSGCGSHEKLVRDTQADSRIMFVMGCASDPSDRFECEQYFDLTYWPRVNAECGDLPVGDPCVARVQAELVMLP